MLHTPFWSLFMRKSEPPGFCPRLGYLAFSFASSALSGRIPSLSCVSCFSWPIPSPGFFSFLGYDQTRMEECRRPAKSTKEGKAEGKWDNLYCFFFPVTRIAQSKWPMIYSVEMNDEYTHSDSLNIIQKCLFNTL